PDDPCPTAGDLLVGPDVRDRAPDHAPRRVEQRPVWPDANHGWPNGARVHDRLDDRDWHLRLAGRATATLTSHAAIVGPTDDWITRRIWRRPRAPPRRAGGGDAGSG